jgi:hypothetical protein
VGCFSIIGRPTHQVLQDGVGEYGTPLQAGSDSGHLQIVKFLLKSGADPNAQGKDIFDPEDVPMTLS